MNDYLDKKVKHLSYRNQEQYRIDTEKMHQLDKEWQEVYARTLAFLDSDQEHIEREIEKGGRHEWMNNN